ncbi:hypothetical protein V6N13_043082 [Hibiscus sabdariffa]|uniref:Membrane-associated kinase regulator 4 n=1 Tax=Hibiscus sabdariffa TaxID=183260 RepID=A0ABR2G2L1_9ROSI
MAINLEDDDEYIDMELSSVYSKSISSREFEFQMSSVSMEKEPTNSPADDLFYKGKLLPLHLPPRLEMVRRLLQNSINEGEVHTTTSFEIEPRSISPSQSGRVSREVEEEHSTDVGNGEIHPKRSWVKRLKLMKQSSIGSKLKAYSRVYLRSLFGNKSTKKSPVAVAVEHNRTSFSMPIKLRHSSPSSNQHLQILKRSNSVNAEMESPIQGAIAHCKQSQHWIRSRKTMSEVGFYSFSAQEPHICRG